ncbi:MAG: hypothetical protein WCC06_12160 [Candidatus Aminicenantales bacterium]
MKYPEKEERIFPIPELKEIPPKEVLDLYLKEQKGKDAGDEMLNWQGLLIGAFLSDFLHRHGFIIAKRKS